MGVALTVPRFVTYARESKSMTQDYTVLLTVTKAIEVSIEAESQAEAWDYVLQSYENGEIDGDEQYDFETL